jgi:hypothetical protein
MYSSDLLWIYDNDVRAMLMGGLEPGETLEISAVVKRVLRPLGDPEGLPDWDRRGIPSLQ